MKISRYVYRKEFIDGMCLKPCGINVLHNGKICHIKYVRITKLRKR